jgi:RHS repeat-associated protein
VSGPTSYTNQLAKVTTYAYDKLGRKTNEIVVGLSTNSFTFSPASDLLTLSDGKSQVTTWAYDAYGRVASKKYADGNTNLIYAYDAGSRLTNRWSAAFGNTKYGYDAIGSLTNIDYPTSADVTFKYDALNRSTNEVVSGVFTNNFTYQSGGAIATEDGPWDNDTLTYTYNAVGLRSGLSIQQASGSYTNGYTYDAAKRLTNVTGHAGAFTYDYYPTNGGITASTHLIRKLTQPPGSYITNSFDNNARMLRTAQFDSSNGLWNDHEYVYNQGDQRTKQTYTDDSHVNYAYDDAGELRTAYTTNYLGAEIATERYQYGYDAAWNMTARTNNASVSTYSVNNLNQNTTTYSYDSNGNPTGASGPATLSYDDENRLTRHEVVLSSRIDYSYDARGRLRKRLQSSYSGGAWNATQTNIFIYDGMLMVEDRETSALMPTTTYTRSTDLSGTFSGAGGIGGLLAMARIPGVTGTNLYYHADGNGNVTCLLSTNNIGRALYRYDPFGRIISSSGVYSGLNTMRFSSKRLDSTTGYYYYGYRFYDPNTQRWLNRDPLQEVGGHNIYRFVSNSPVTLFDPYGQIEYDPNCFAKCGKQNLIELGICTAILAGTTVFCIFNPAVCLALLDPLLVAQAACFAAAELHYAACTASCVLTRKCPYPLGPYPGGISDFP